MFNNVLIFLFIKNILFVFERQSGTKRRVRDLPSAGSLPVTVLAGAKVVRSQKLLPVSHVGAESQALSYPLLFSQANRRELDQKWKS